MVVAAGLSAWISKLVTERILSRWRSKEQADLERLKDELSGARLLLEHGIASLSAANEPLAQRRLVALERLWDGVCTVRRAFSKPVFFYSIVLPSEFNRSLRDGGRPASSFAPVTDIDITGPVEKTGHVELERPFLGELLWWKFFTYRAFLGRLAVLLKQGQEAREVRDWREDSYIRAMVAGALPEDATRRALAEATGLTAVRQITDAFESAILEEIQAVASGRPASIESLRSAKQLQAIASHSEPAPT